MDGSEGPPQFPPEIRCAPGTRVHVNVEMFDERLSSFESRDRLTDMPAGRASGKPVSTRLRRS